MEFDPKPFLADLESRLRKLERLSGGLCPHAIGDYYLTESTTPPGTRWPGTTWVELAGRVLVGRDATQTEFDTIGEQGGSKDAVAVAHAHALNAQFSLNDGVAGQATSPVRVGAETNRYTTSVPSGQAVSSGVDGGGKNLQPYRVCYVWRRTA